MLLQRFERISPPTSSKGCRRHHRTFRCLLQDHFPCLYSSARSTKVRVYYGYPYVYLQEADFSIRFDGNRFTFYCKRLNAYRRCIRRARALLIRQQVITAQPSQYWKLNKRRTNWTFNTPDGPVSVPSNEVYWALSDSRNLVETYHLGKVTRWKIVRTVSQCYLCDAAYEKKSKPYWYGYSGRGSHLSLRTCDGCREQLETDWMKVVEDWSNEKHGRWVEATTRDEVDVIASRDRSSNVRWIRKFVAQGSFTRSEFRALCKEYGNICLRCKRKRILVADHVIPLLWGGSSDIANIQPLCKECNTIKGGDSFADYREGRRMSHGRTSPS